MPYKFINHENLKEIIEDANQDEKIFEVEGGFFTLSQFLHSNTSDDTGPIEEDFIRRLIDLNVNGIIDDYDPNYPPVKRVR